jgi:predicted nucleic acid-binding protein
MDKVFLDANCLIDYAMLRDDGQLIELLIDDQKCICILSLHILAYVGKYRLPDENFSGLLDFLDVFLISEEVMKSSMDGPTSDYEDNLQLNCAVENDCDVFITSDKKLLKLSFFGKMKIISPKDLKISQC